MKDEDHAQVYADRIVKLRSKIERTEETFDCWLIV